MKMREEHEKRGITAVAHAPRAKRGSCAERGGKRWMDTH